MRRDVDEITRLQVDRLVIALEEQLGFALQHDNPFVLVLIVPEAVGTGLACGDNPLDADVLVLGEDINKFLGKLAREVGEEVVHRCSFLL